MTIMKIRRHHCLGKNAKTSCPFEKWCFFLKFCWSLFAGISVDHHVTLSCKVLHLFTKYKVLSATKMKNITWYMWSPIGWRILSVHPNLWRWSQSLKGGLSVRNKDFIWDKLKKVSFWIWTLVIHAHPSPFSYNTSIKHPVSILQQWPRSLGRSLWCPSVVSWVSPRGWRAKTLRARAMAPSWRAMMRRSLYGSGGPWGHDSLDPMSSGCTPRDLWVKIGIHCFYFN